MHQVGTSDNCPSRSTGLSLNAAVAAAGNTLPVKCAGVTGSWLCLLLDLGMNLLQPLHNPPVVCVVPADL